MLLRIVRMTFKEERTEDFLALFDSVSGKIRNFQGCTYLKLMRDLHDPLTFVTYSKWDSQEDLDNYRNSALFGTVWKKTKSCFSAKPIAFSLIEFSGEIVP
ncbi:MAG: antibiotic biosynthesis monooxygenase family protein [Cyclobacteriaceae bacterium]